MQFGLDMLQKLIDNYYAENPTKTEYQLKWKLQLSCFLH